jgi:SAM-dependent methyltransferase
MPVSQRKLLGAWYTPPALVDAVVTEVRRGFSPRNVLDPACGDGRFLAPFADTAEVTGVDIDPSTSWTCADALSIDWDDRQFDAVVGNPPFLNQLAASTSRGGRSKFGGGPYADSAAEFLALAIRLTRPGGRVGLVLPLSMLSTRDVATIRDDVSRRAALRWMWWSTTQMFDANVRVWAGVWEVGGDQGDVRRAHGPRFETRPTMAMPAQWAGLIADTIAAPGESNGPVLGDVAGFTADFRDQYYGLVGAVSDTADGPPLITSGLIEPGECWWGRRSVRFAKQRFAAPRVDISALSPALQRWATTRLVPKILIANQTRRIEAVIDRTGEWLPSVPVITCTTDRLDEVAAVLHSDAATEWVRYHAAGSGLSATAVRLTARLLASIPLPATMVETPTDAS